MTDAAKLILKDGSVEFVPAEDVDSLKMLIEKHTERSLTGSASYLDDLKFLTSSGRVLRLKEIESVE